MWAKLSCDPEERLRHPVTMDGIDCDVERIYISRFLEEVETSNTQGIYIIVIIITAQTNNLPNIFSFHIYSHPDISH